MNFRLKYGKSEVGINLGSEVAPVFLEREEPAEKAVPGIEIIKNALSRSENKLADFIGRGDSVAVVVSDQTRPTGSEIYLKLILDEVKAAGSSDITVILAQGLHRPATQAEIEKIFGGKVPEWVSVVNHDAVNGLKELGGASYRAEAVDADKLIITGAVTFHPMAGFSGGRKSLLPGIASAEDIKQNHRQYFRGRKHNPVCGPGLINENPVRDDINKRTSGFKELWALNVVMGESKEILFASCGNTEKVWSECVKWVSAGFSIGIEEQYDKVISAAGGYPSDFSFYQSMKVLTNTAKACRDGGRMIILSECVNGWEIDADMLKLFSRSEAEIADILIADFRMDVLGLFMARSIINRYEVWLYSDLPREEVESAGMHYIDDITMIEELASGGRTAVIKNGSSILPISDEQRKELL